jgi:hypothetical protein
MEHSPYEGSLIVAQLVKKFHEFFVTLKFNTVLTRARHWTLPVLAESDLHPYALLYCSFTCAYVS